MSTDSKPTRAQLKAEACRLLREGLSATEVRDQTGASRTSIYRWAKEMDIDVQAKHVPPSKRFDRAAIREMMAMHSVEEVCETFGCSRSFAYMCASGTLEP